MLPAGSNALAAVNPNVGLVSLDRLDDVLVTFGARGTAASLRPRRDRDADRSGDGDGEAEAVSHDMKMAIARG